MEEKKVNDDLIITREINFDKDVLDLKNKKTLAELREAIEEFDRLESYPKKSVNKITEERNKENLNNHSKYKKRSDRYLSEEEQGILLSSKKNNFRKKFDSLKYDNNDKQKAILILLSMILFVILIGVLGFYYGSKETDNNSIVDKRFDEQKFNSKKLEEEKKQKDFSECLSKSYSEQELNEQINKKVLELNEYIKANYDASIFYEDLSLGFSYSYNSSVVYYAASTIKSLDALYIYTKASLGEINLDDTMIYSSKYKWGSSKEMKKYQYGQKVTLRNLVKYAVTVSDNSAHQMLVDYIGKKNLKEFGKSLGATNTLVGADNFGSIDVKDGIIYMKAINDFIINNGELGDELKNYFVVAEQNDLSLPDLGIEAAHKYGQYGYYYHDIGIVYDEHPYVVAILTNEGAKNYEAKVKDINKHIYDLHKEFYLNRENVCQIEIYGN